MRYRVIAPVVLLAASLFVTNCSDDSTSPQDEGPVTFSRLMGGRFSHAYANDVVTTSDGLRVVGGSFYGAMHVDGSVDSMVATQYDAFLVAFRDDGSVAWKRSAGGAGTEYLNGMARDAGDNIYVGGSYGGDTVFGGISLTNNGGHDALVAKFNSDGNPVWVVGGGAAGDDVVWDIATAANGDVFACGLASSEMVLAGEDFGEFGSTSGFLVNIHPSGVGGWAATAYGTGTAECKAVTTTGDGDVLVAGAYNSSTVEIAGSILPVDTYDSFIARYSVLGDPAGAIRIGGSGIVNLNEITDINGGPVVVGALFGSEDFDVTAAGGEETSAGAGDAVVARYNADGTFRWVRKFGATANEGALDVCRIGASDLLVVGTFDGGIDLGPGSFSSRGFDDYFLVRLDADGNIKSASHLGAPGYDQSIAIKATGGTMVVVGSTSMGDFLFPDGTKRSSFDTDSFIYQQP